MGLSIWSQEGNVGDLSLFFMPPKEKETAAQALDTPAYLNVAEYQKAPEKGGQTYTQSIFSVWTVALVFGVLYALGVIKS